eukprot:CAMPEP_0119391730 /NCGR_PEP_ID=MMETSP1334-20130426/118278_1 /TAXON_ID=127549 /ORGANISM="Calcidiscus leptoporus, Strain RCC1130" /LENGTH=79 /DNA_ID=CAMNT_0007414455 /DNA_START=32 /DNA_END=268 /DNA_ORIENTATION=-
MDRHAEAAEAGAGAMAEHAMGNVDVDDEESEGGGESEEKEDVYVVEKLLQSRHTASGVEYLVKWEGYENDESTWEPEEN